MEICYFGAYESDYPRNRIIINGLRENGVNVKECRSNLWKSEEDKTKILRRPLHAAFLPLKAISSSFLLLLRFFFIAGYRCQFIIVGYPAHHDIFLAYLLSRLSNQSLVFNPLISVYDTLIDDRKLFKKTSFIARFIFSLEKIIFRLPDLILLDTQAHIALLRKVLDIPKQRKMVKVFVGADEELFPFSPYKGPGSVLKILFFGKFIPLHGIPVILEAAKRLENYTDIHFTIVGQGQLSDNIHRQAEKLHLKNLEFVSWIPYHRLSQTIEKIDICLGIFDGGEKAESVIPNKIFEALAVGRTVITRLSPATTELFTDGKNIILCSPNNPQSLVDKILFLKSHPETIRSVAKEGHNLFETKLTEDKIGLDVINALRQVRKI